jgi:hypothetical protein
LRAVVFGMNLPKIDLKEINDIIGITDPMYSFLKESVDILPDGREFILNLMESADPSKLLSVSGLGYRTMASTRAGVQPNAFWGDEISKVVNGVCEHDTF